MTVTLQNNLLKVEISSFGAELQSIRSERTGAEYLYQGNTPFWGRRSPVLFPLVGAVWQGSYSLDGRSFELGQHGFARDREFEVIEDTPSDEAWFRLRSSEETLKLFPRRFTLEVGYRLQAERLTVLWRVYNDDDREMPFQIGAHPAFLYPDFNAADAVHAYIFLDRREVESDIIIEEGCIGPDKAVVGTDDDGMIPVTAQTFDIGTIIIEGDRVHRVSMLDKERRPWVTLLFRAPVVGIWSPSPQAPFMCIEPWYGRTDRVGDSLPFDRHEYVQTLAPGGSFDADYLMVFDSL